MKPKLETVLQQKVALLRFQNATPTLPHTFLGAAYPVRHHRF